jgi:2-oxoisovalerate dehydrogenase E2 component (dihydrolipoyl transacylase)
MAAHVIRVPDLGEGIAEVELVVWHVTPGDAVVEDQALADVMTDKASVEIPSPVAGKVLALGGEVGQMLAVGSELISIEVADETSQATQPRTEGAANQPASSAAVPSTPAAPAAPPRADRAAHADAQRRVRTRPHAASHRAPIASPARSRARLGARHRPARRRRDRTGRPHRPGRPRRPRRARRRALEARSGAPRAAAATPRTTIKIVGLRRKIAQKMQESKRRIPHYTYVEEVDVTELEALRAQLNEKWAPSAAPHAARRSWSAPSSSRCASSRWSTRASTTRPAC